MEITESDANASLKAIAAAQKKVQVRSRYRGPDVLYVVWGTIWAIGFCCQHFIPIFQIRGTSWDISIPGSIVWTPLVLVGIIVSILVSRKREGVQDESVKGIGALWGVVFGYFYMWIFLMGPLFKHEAMMSPEGLRHMTAVISTIPMCIYVIMGLMGCGVYMIWLGLGVTILTAVGLWFLPDYFYLWMAVLGSGSLFLAGFLANREWRKA